MKKVVRNIFWWPGISKAIDRIAANCPGCRKFKKNLLLTVYLFGLSLDGRWSVATLIFLNIRVNMF